MSECPYCGEPLTEDGECDDAGCAFDLVPIGDGTSDDRDQEPDQAIGPDSA